MNQYLILPCIAMACYFIVEMAHITWKVGLRFKPFNCAMCLTFWISFIYLLFLHTNPFELVILSGATAYLTAPLNKLL